MKCRIASRLRHSRYEHKDGDVFWIACWSRKSEDQELYVRLLASFSTDYIALQSIFLFFEIQWVSALSQVSLYLYALHSAMHHLQSFSICRFAFEWTQTWTYMHGKVCWTLKSICRRSVLASFHRRYRRRRRPSALLLLAALSSFSFGRHYYVNGISNRFVMLLKKQYSWLQFINTCTFLECIRI